MSEEGGSKSYEQELKDFKFSKADLARMRNSYQEFEECDKNGNKNMNASLDFTKKKMEMIIDKIVKKGISDRHLQSKRPLISNEDIKKKKKDLRLNYHQF